MQALAGVFFHMQAGDADPLRPRAGGGDVDVAVLGNRLVVLRNLVALGQVGIEIILAREDRPLAHPAVDGERSERGELDRLLVQHRQSTGQAQADRADIRIRRGTETIQAAAECLGCGEQLDMDFESDYGLIPGQNRGIECGSGHIGILARRHVRASTPYSAGSSAVNEEQHGFLGRVEIHQLHANPVRVEEVELAFAVAAHLRVILSIHASQASRSP